MSRMISNHQCAAIKPRQQMLQRIDVDAADEPIIHGEDETPDGVTPAEDTETQTISSPQNEGYNPNFADHGSPISKVKTTQTDLEEQET